MPSWPPLPLAQWQDTYATLHLWTQLLGKSRLALCPMENHYWHAALYVSTRGLTTGPMPTGDGLVEVELDFVSHGLIARSSDGAVESFSLTPMTVADFHLRYTRALHALGVDLQLFETPIEVADRTPLAEDRHHGAYDADAAHRCWEILRDTDRVLKQYRGAFLGKSSPVNFWWGSFDLAISRFSGRRAPSPPSGVPYIPDRVVREAYSHECHSVGWWPGGSHGVVKEPVVTEPAFFSYAFPEPQGFSTARIAPAQAYYHPAMFEWILPYEAVRTARDPDAALRAFADSTYEAAATLGNWDRAAFERLAA